MSTLRNPVGPQSSKVYWRRRLLVGLGVLAVIVIIVLIVSRPGSGATAKIPVPSPTTSTAPAATAGKAAAGKAAAGKASDACAPANITLEAVTDQSSYAAGVDPKVAMKITNTGTGSCTINLGSTQQELIITSGTETIWDSKDCQTGGVDTPTVMTAGQSLTTPSIPWDRTRSSTTTCQAASRPSVTAGGASYHLAVKLGSITSKKTVQFLLN